MNDTQTQDNDSREFLILERVVCKNFPLSNGDTDKRPVIISGIHYDRDDTIIALSVFQMPLRKPHQGFYSKDMALDESHYESGHGDFQPHVIDTATQTTLPISHFDLERPFLGVVNNHYVPDAIARRLFAVCRHPNIEQTLIDTTMIEYSETLIEHPDFSDEDIQKITNSVNDFLANRSSIQWPRLGTWSPSDTQWPRIQAYQRTPKPKYA